MAEGFVDRGYTPDGRLVPRSEPEALVTDVAEVVRRCVRLVTEHELEAVDGSVLTVDVSSVCVHSDTSGAVALARAVRGSLEAAGVDVQPFAV